MVSLESSKNLSIKLRRLSVFEALAEGESVSMDIARFVIGWNLLREDRSDRNGSFLFFSASRSTSRSRNAIAERTYLLIPYRAFAATCTFA